jgi:N6-adenosine-specific RNA methylase IME4
MFVRYVNKSLIARYGIALFVAIIGSTAIIQSVRIVINSALLLNMKTLFLERLIKKPMKISDIQIGKRFRQNMGDLEILADSIKLNGLLHPVVVDSDGNLVAGRRRLEACKLLGWEDVPVHVVSVTDMLAAEHDENVVREDFLLSEMVAIRDALFPAENRAAKERQGGKGRERCGKLPQQSKAKARDKVARYTGVSGRTLEKATKLVHAAEKEPKKYRRFVDEMDRTRRVHGVYKKLKVEQQAEAIKAEPEPLPEGPFRVIVVDPPWHYSNRNEDPTHRAGNPYASMSIEEIRHLPIAELAAKDAILWLWTTNAHIREAFDVLDAWDFEYKTMLTWIKHKMGLGDWLRGKTEHCLLAIRGKPVVALTNQTTALEAKSCQHSAKPVEFYDMVEALCPGSKLEMFLRGGPRKGWHGWGHEAR